MEEIPFPAGFLRRNLLPQRNIVKGKPVGKWWAVETPVASTANRCVPSWGRLCEKRRSGEWRSHGWRARHDAPLRTLFGMRVEGVGERQLGFEPGGS
jgi:hypothetical protein